MKSGDVIPSARPSKDLVHVDLAVLKDGTLTIMGSMRGFGVTILRAEIRFGEATTVIDEGHLMAGDEPGRCKFLVVMEVSRRNRRSYLRVLVADNAGSASGSVWPVSVEPKFAPASPSQVVAAAEASGTLPVKAILPMARVRVERCWLLNGSVLVLLGYLPGESFSVEVDGGVPAGLRAEGRGPAMSNDSLTEHVDAAAHRLEWCVLSWDAAVDGRAFALAIGADPTRAVLMPVLDAVEIGEQLEELCSRLKADHAIDLLKVALHASHRRDSHEVSATWLRQLLAAQVARLPLTLDVSSPRVLVHCDSTVRVGDQGVVIRGWFHFTTFDVESVSYGDELGMERIDDTWTTHPRGDVATHLTALGLQSHGDRHGFSCFVPSAHGGQSPHLELRLASGRTLRARLGLPGHVDSLPAIREILASFAHSDRNSAERLDACLGPALTSIWGNRQKPRTPVYREFLGPPVASPALSIIVPLYARFDLAEYQLALFANDPSFARHELIYFVDDPAIFEEFRLRCRDLYETYHVPFVLLYAGANLGFAGANNCAASHASGRYLLFLNSDVFPSRPAWTEAMLRCYQAHDDCGVLGVKLLFEDGGVQHVGMEFSRHAPWRDMWINKHPSRGESSASFTGVRAVPAVTAACALVGAQLFRDLGGFSEEYVLGDFEDSDLCLKATRAGKRNYVLLDEALYHLERQSFSRVGDAHWRANLTFLNCWQHHRKWSRDIEALQPDG